jgi:glycosyltransferase involved in cell wall biosynthesis
MRVLAITNEFPLPLDRGGRVRCFGLARALADEYEMHLLALRRPSTTQALETRLSSALGGPVEVFDPGMEPRDTLVGRWSRAMRRGVPPWITAQHSPELERRARELAPSMDAIVVLDDYAAMYAAALSPAAPVVCDKHNVMGFSATLAPPQGGARRRVQRRLAILTSRRFERAALGHADAVVTTSDEESERLEQLYGRPASAVVPSAVDVPATPREPAGAPVVGWLGTHEYAANVEGLMRFVEDGWEPLGAGGFQLLVAGGGAPPEVLELDARAGVDILGFVDDLDGLFARLGVAVVPIWRGAGVKLKTLTFMAAGVPVVGTPAAVEGIDGQDGNHFLVAEDPAGLAEGIRRVVSDAELARRLGAGGRELVRERYSWPAVGARFRADVERAVAAADGNPRG